MIWKSLTFHSSLSESDLSLKPKKFMVVSKKEQQKMWSLQYCDWASWWYLTSIYIYIYIYLYIDIYILYIYIYMYIYHFFEYRFFQYKSFCNSVFYCMLYAVTAAAISSIKKRISVSNLQYWYFNTSRCTTHNLAKYDT